MRLYRRLKSPLCVQIELTSACNCKCSHCYNYWRPTTEKPKKMTEEVADRILQIMKENEIQKACLTGGEPFLNFGIFKYFVEKMQENNIKVSTNTNLSAISQQQLEYALKHNIRILTTVMGADAATHDSMTNAKGAFEHTIDNIKKCVKAGNDIMVNIVVSQEIINKVYEIASFIAKLGVKTIFASVVICPEYAKGTEKERLFSFDEDDIAKVLNAMLDVRDEYGVEVGTITTFPLCCMKKVRDVTPFMNRRCVAGRTELGISCEGKVARCPQSGDYVGDLTSEDFKSIWERIDDCATSLSLPEVCVSCPLFKMCSGGCRVSGKSETGHWNGLDPKTNPVNVPIILKNIKENMKKLLPGDMEGYCRKEEFGSVLIRKDGNYALLDQYFTEKELKEEKNIEKHILPIVLNDVSCNINDECDTCRLYDVCYNIHNCR